jgi:hypothetical protein
MGILLRCWPVTRPHPLNGARQTSRPLSSSCGSASATAALSSPAAVGARPWSLLPFCIRTTRRWVQAMQPRRQCALLCCGAAPNPADRAATADVTALIHNGPPAGIGPTHDDVTYEAIAEAFGRSLERHAPTVALMQQHYDGGCGGQPGGAASWQPGMWPALRWLAKAAGCARPPRCCCSSSLGTPSALPRANAILPAHGPWRHLCRAPVSARSPGRGAERGASAHGGAAYARRRGALHARAVGAAGCP